MVEQVQILFQALGLTLLHFCWQGAIIAVAAKLVSSALPALRPRAQYAISLFAMLAMAAAAVATFAWEQVRLGKGDAAFGPEAATIGAVIIPQGIEPMSLLPWLDAVWAAGVLALALRTLNGLWAIHRLKANAQPVPEALAARFARAALILGLSNVHIRMHAGIDSPFVVGVFRSVVYLPVSAVMTLSPDQIDAVLAHELEHIRRADFAWNLLQTVLETLFFYHPAVWWLGRSLREQRELACDDAAVRTCSDPLTYATALLRLEEQRRATPHLAVALNGDGSGPTLLSRVRRILGDTPKGTQAMSPRKVSRPALLAAPVVLITLATLAVPAAQVVAGTDGGLAKICNIKSLESVTGSSGLAGSLAANDAEIAGPEMPAAEAGAADVEPQDFWSGLITPQKDEGNGERDSTWTWVADLDPHVDHEAIARAQAEGLAEAAEAVRHEAEQMKATDPVRARQMRETADRLATQSRTAQDNAAINARHVEAMAYNAEVMAHNAAVQAIDVKAIQKSAEREARKAEMIARKVEMKIRKDEMKFRKGEFAQEWNVPEPPEPPVVPAVPAMAAPPAPAAPPALTAPPVPPAPPAPLAKPLAVMSSPLNVKVRVITLPNGKFAVDIEDTGRKANAVPSATLNAMPAASPMPLPAPNPKTDVVVSVQTRIRAG